MKIMNVKKVVILATMLIMMIYSITFADTEKRYVAEGFEIDPELLKCATSSANREKIDENEDGIITLEEWRSTYTMTLDCHGYEIKDWSALTYFMNMGSLIIRNCDDADLSVLCDTNSIQAIEIYANDINTIKGINSERLNIKTVAVHSENAMDIKLLSNCKNIETLSVSAPTLYNYEILSDITKLNSLSISLDSASGIDKLKDIEQVSKLKVSCPELDDLSFLQAFSNLVTLDLRGCNITDASKIGKQKKIRNIDLRNNNITDIYWINDLEERENLKTIYLSGNPILKEDILKAFVGYNGDSHITGKEGDILSLVNAYPECDVINSNDIVKRTSDDGIVKIVDGNIRFYVAGEANVYIESSDGVFLEYKVTVVEKEDGTYFYILKGDADNNDEVNAKDTLKILKLAAKIEEPDSKFSIRKNDFNQDYKVNSEDALHVLKIAARLEEQETIDDPENFFDDIEYINGYPTADFMSKDIYNGISFSLEQGKIESSRSGGSIKKIENGQFGTRETFNKESEQYLKTRWELIWLAQDAIAAGKLEKVYESSNDIVREIENDSSYKGYYCRFSGYAQCMASQSTAIEFYITDENELFLISDNRLDIFLASDTRTVFKYTGEMPENLTYEVIEAYYNSETNE